MQVLSCICCMKRNLKGAIALRANVVRDIIEIGLGDIKELTIGEVLLLKNVFGLSDTEATYVFLGGMTCENLQV